MTVAVDIGGVEEVASQINGCSNGTKGFLILGGAVAVPELVAANRPSAEAYFGHFEVGRSQFTVFQCPGAAAAGALAGGGALCAPIPTERCFSSTSAQGPMGLPAAFTGTSGTPLASLSQVILKSS